VQLASTLLFNLNTAAGKPCFLPPSYLMSYLMIPELFDEEAPS
jgi:hypothetical protein